MAGGRDIRAGGAFIELYGKDSGLEKMLDRIGRKIKGFASGVARVGAGIAAFGGTLLAPLIASAKAFADMGGNMMDASKRTGITVETLSELAYAADQSGASLESLETGIKGMSKVVSAAASGNKEAIDTLDQLGTSVAELDGMSPDQIFLKLADAVNDVKNDTQQAAAAMAIFGKSGMSLLPFIKEGADGINKLTSQARKLGITMSAEDATAADDFGDALGSLWAQVKMVAFQVGAAASGPFMLFTAFLGDAMKAAIDFAKENRSLAAIIGSVGAGMVAAGAGIVGLATVIGAVGMAFSTLATAVGAVMFLISPAGALVAGAALLAINMADLNKAVDAAPAIWESLKNTAASTMEGIKAAIGAGDIEMALQIVGAGLNIVWLNVCKGLNALWGQTWADMKTLMLDVGLAMRSILNGITYRIQQAWDNIATMGGLRGNLEQRVKDRNFNFEKEERDIVRQKLEQDRNIARDLKDGAKEQELIDANKRLEKLRNDAMWAQAEVPFQIKEAIAGKNFEAAIKTETRGGFDASLVARQAPIGSTPQERMAKGIDEVAKNTREIKDKLQPAEFV